MQLKGKTPRGHAQIKMSAFFDSTYRDFGKLKDFQVYEIIGDEWFKSRSFGAEWSRYLPGTRTTAQHLINHSLTIARLPRLEHRKKMLLQHWESVQLVGSDRTLTLADHVRQNEARIDRSTASNKVALVDFCKSMESKPLPLSSVQFKTDEEITSQISDVGSMNVPSSQLGTKDF